MNYIQTEKNIILDSRSIILEDASGKLMIPVIYNSEELGRIELSFVGDGSMSGGAVLLENGDDMMKVKCINFNETLGRFTLSPIKLGEIDNKALTIHVWSSISGEKRNFRRIEYTLFLEK